jgi:hypothetical protein
MVAAMVMGPNGNAIAPASDRILRAPSISRPLTQQEYVPAAHVACRRVVSDVFPSGAAR